MTAMKRPAGRRWLGLLGLSLIGASLALFAYAATATGAVDAVGTTWDQARRQLAGPSALENGARIYQATCAVCHGGPTGGDISDHPPKHNANGHTWEHGDCELVAVIRAGQGPLTESMRRSTPPPGALTMPAYGERMSDRDIRGVVAFIKTMWTAEQRSAQERVTRERCGPPTGG